VSSLLGDTSLVPSDLANLEKASPVRIGLVGCGVRIDPRPAGGDE